jgi:O-acetyl-ADP-ribose deacetylase
MHNSPELVEGDLLDMDVDVIVNAWNRNIIPWWLLLPHGVSGAIKRRGGLGIFRELAKFGAIPLGEGRITGAGMLSQKAIIHVAGISLIWRSSQQSICDSVSNAMRIFCESEYSSIAFPIIGAGSGGGSEDECLLYMQNTFESIETQKKIFIVRYRKE